MSEICAKPPLCRNPRCAQGAGSSGYCPDHLQAALRRYSLPQLVDLAAELIDEAALRPRQFPADPPAPAPLLN